MGQGPSKASQKKRTYFTTWQKYKNGETFANYNLAKKEAKILVREAKSNAYGSSYQKVDIEEQERDIYNQLGQKNISARIKVI